MKEIKFRAWNPKFQFMDYNPDAIIKCLHPNFERVEGLQIMQYTGLKDKNGKEIYEGDIVDIPNFKETWKRGEPQGNWRRFKVEWNQHTYAFNNEWIYRPLSSYDTKDLMPLDIEIIGNIYENSDLR